MPAQRLLASLLALAGAALYGQAPERARSIHRDALVFDAHVHMVTRQFYWGGDIGQRAPDGQVDLPRMVEGGVDALFFSLYVTEEYYPSRLETKQTLRLIDAAHRQIERNRGRIEVALNASDVERLQKAGKVAAVLDIEGGFDLDGDPAVIGALYRLGVRSLQLPAHNWANNFADSCCAERKFGGLNERGRAVVREMNRLGMVINVSHASEETIEQVLDVSTGPVIATHHGLKSFNDIPRNVSDRVLKKLAAKGGLIGIQIGADFHHPPMFAWRTKQAGKAFWDTSAIGRREARLPIEEIDRIVAPKFPMVGMNAPDALLLSVDQWVNVVDRAIQLAGDDHVIVGTDFDGGPTLPRGMRDIRDLPMVTDAMLRRGYSEERIRKYLGGNLLRVFRQITERKQ
jgi:membrane dipeptidase